MRGTLPTGKGQIVPNTTLVLLTMTLTCIGSTFARASSPSRENFRVTTAGQPQADIAGFVLHAGLLPKGTIFFAHGWGCNKEMMFDCYSRVPQEYGWNAVFFDFRQHGQSSKSSPVAAPLFTTLGYFEVWDFKELVDWAERRGLAKPYVCLGASMGAAISLRFAGQDSRIQAVFAESPYRTGLDAEKAFHFRDFGQHRAMVEKVDLRVSAAQRSDLRTYILAGENDWFPIAQQREIIDASPAPDAHKHFVVVKGGGHANFLGLPDHTRWLSHLLSTNANANRAYAAAAAAPITTLAIAWLVKRRRSTRAPKTPAPISN
jgi:pimeloyl-ACP methyl ester carboxylesterase